MVRPSMRLAAALPLTGSVPGRGTFFEGTCEGALDRVCTASDCMPSSPGSNGRVSGPLVAAVAPAATAGSPDIPIMQTAATGTTNQRRTRRPVSALFMPTTSDTDKQQPYGRLPSGSEQPRSELGVSSSNG